MLDYVSNLLPRLKQYSKDLDKIENFVNKKWRVIDNRSENLSFIFLRDGRLLISVVSNNKDQKTIEGSWELLPTNELYLKRPEPILLEQGFIGEGILILQESGTNNLPFCCFDPKVIRDVEEMAVYLENALDIGDNTLPYVFSLGGDRYTLPEPTKVVSVELSNPTPTLKFMVQNYRRYINFCKSETAPVYFAYEIIRREKHIQSDILNHLDNYSRDSGYRSFNDLIERYKD